MQLLETHKVPELNHHIRLQDYVVGIFETISTKSGNKKAIKKGLVYVNGEVAKTGQLIKGNEIIELFKETLIVKKQFHFQLEVLFEDEFLAVIHKPAGIVVSGNSFATINNCLSQNITPSSQRDAVTPRAVHRLDYPTSGLLLISKTNSTTRALSKLFENKEIHKLYHAVTIEKMNNSGIIDFPIDGKEAFSEFKVIHTLNSKKYGALNLVELTPKTGRRHQLRKHLHAIGNPILGDKDYYFDGKISFGNGLYLHASSLIFMHPITNKKMKFSTVLPKKFMRLFPQILNN